jgi:hypothetical protein
MFDAPGRVIESGGRHLRMLAEKTTALRQRDGMRQNLADIRYAGAGETDEIVSNTEQQFPLDLHIGLEKKIEVFHNGTRKRVLNGDHSRIDLSALHQLENLCRVGTGNNGCLRLHL